MSILAQYKKKVDTAKSNYKLAVQNYKEEKQNLEECAETYQNTEEAREIVQEVAIGIQQQAHKQIAAVVTRCLQSIFDEPYTFHIHFEAKRGKTEARLVFEKDGHELDPLTASGGGVIDVAAFALRLSCLMLSRPALRRIMVLDEPFKNVSKANGYLDRIPTLLKSLAEDLKVQFIMVTHIEELKVGNVVELTGTGKVKVGE